MRIRRWTATLAAAAMLCILTTAAHANLIDLVITSAVGDNPQVSGNTVAFGSAGGTVSYDIFLTTTDFVAGISLSAAFAPGNFATGTRAPNVGPLLPPSFPPFSGGSGSSSGTLDGWDYGNASPGMTAPPGTYAIGTLTILAQSSDTVQFGVLAIDDGLLDANFQSIPLAPGVAWITVVPEPGTALLVAVGLAGLSSRRRAAR